MKGLFAASSERFKTNYLRSREILDEQAKNAGNEVAAKKSGISNNDDENNESENNKATQITAVAKKNVTEIVEQVLRAESSPKDNADNQQKGVDDHDVSTKNTVLDGTSVLDSSSSKIKMKRETKDFLEFLFNIVYDGEMNKQDEQNHIDEISSKSTKLPLSFRSFDDTVNRFGTVNIGSDKANGHESKATNDEPQVKRNDQTDDRKDKLDLLSQMLHDSMTIKKESRNDNTIKRSFPNKEEEEEEQQQQDNKTNNNVINGNDDETSPPKDIHFDEYSQNSLQQLRQLKHDLDELYKLVTSRKNIQI